MDENLKLILDNFEKQGHVLVAGKRNLIKVFPYQGQEIAIKSFRIPILINGFIYRFFRKSKARRSFENAKLLLENGIGTPNPIAYFENFNSLFLKESYYISENLVPDYVFKNFFGDDSNPDLEPVLRGIAQFTFKMHERGIEFLDHSPGNTLIKKTKEGTFSYFLVDLNRMNFHKEMSFKHRMKNLSRITPSKEMIQVISNEYAKLSGIAEATVFNTLWQYTQEFQFRFIRKQKLKKKVMFWKN